MDCRHVPRLAVLALLPLSGLAAAGCTHEEAHQFINPPPPAVAAQVKKEADQPKVVPQPKTCVAAGSMFENAANEPNRSPADKERLLDQARKAYQQALDLDPNYLPALKGLGRVYTGLKDGEHVEATYQRAMKAYPKDPSLPFELGMWHARRREWDPALQHLKMALDLDPENRQCANTLGFCLARAGRYDESLAVFRKTGGEAQAHCNLARMLHHLKQEDLSRQHAQMALQQDPQLAAAQQLLAELDGKAEEAPAPRVEGP